MWDLIPLLLLHSLATAEVVEVVHHGSIFGWLRAVALQAETTQGASRWLLTPVRAIGCAFCFSVWAAILLAPLAWLGHQGHPWALVALLALAGARTANLLNDTTHRWSRTPKDPPGPEALRHYSPEALETEILRRTGEDVLS